MAEPIHLTLLFAGGAELLFDRVKRRDVVLPDLKDYLPDCGSEKWTVRQLVLWIREFLLKEREALFLQGDEVRPGILVLINDEDWELCGTMDYELQNKDSVMFISTLHGSTSVTSRIELYTP
ncbi:hypothetical protein PYW07_012894 [Mythimna separata]|uniref:Ubiquitin-related modifier 1 homolog n=1 Tax=Mythimna separata TaxID=271217 RepID=A0AAD7Y977_MYTSE|nr:hypothetical protein PYW07_012894 [Mythimna separata]